MRCDAANSELIFCCRFSDRQKYPSNKQKPRPSKHVEPAHNEKAGKVNRTPKPVEPTLFRSEYWRKFPTHISKKYEASIVFAEVRPHFIIPAAHGNMSCIYLLDIKNCTF